MSKDFKISVVTPVYKVEQYLDETIESVINQSIGFEDNIQLILVNDGSPDNSGEICKKYRAQYPDNIIYVEQENAGVSVARNNGMTYATGEYINFLDSDDRWSADSFERVLDFAENHKDVDIFTCPMQFFEALDEPHMLNYKFDCDRVVDINDADMCNFMHIHITSSVIRTELAKSLKFTEGMVLGEDALYLTSLILKQGRYGAVSTAQHYYRKRALETSAVQTRYENVRFYNETIEKFYGGLILASRLAYGSVIPYIQNVLNYDIGWRMKHQKPAVLTDEEYQNYLDKLSEVIKCIDDELIITNTRIHKSIFLKKAMLRLKYGEDVLTDLVFNPENHYLSYKGIKLTNVRSNRTNCELTSLDLQDNKFVITGLVKSWIVDAKSCDKIVISIAGREAVAELKPYPNDVEETIFGINYRYYEFKAAIAIDDAFVEKDKRLLRPKVYFDGEPCCFNQGFKSDEFFTKECCPTAYRMVGDYAVTCIDKGFNVMLPVKPKKKAKMLEEKHLDWLKENGLSDMAKARKHKKRKAPMPFNTDAEFYAVAPQFAADTFVLTKQH